VRQEKTVEGLDISHDLTETAQLIDLDTLDNYEKDVRKTVLLYYGDNGFETQQDVADHLDCKRETVSNRLRSDEAKQFMKMFSHRDRDELERWFEDLAARHYNKALKGLRLAVKNASERKDVSPQVLKSCSMALLKADEQLAKNLQEFGAIDKPKERKEVQETSGEITFNEEIVTKDDDNDDVAEDAETTPGKKEEEEVVTE